MADDDKGRGKDTPGHWQNYPRSGADDQHGPQDPDPPEVLLRKAEQRAREAEERARKAEREAAEARDRVEFEAREAEARARREARRARYQGAQEEREDRRRIARERRKRNTRQRSGRPGPAAVLGRRLWLGFGWVVLVVVAVGMVIGIVGDLDLDADRSGSSRSGTFARPPTPTPQATERALRAGQPLTVVTGGSRAMFRPDGTGRVVIGPASRGGSWQTGVADLRTEKVLWSAAMVPGAAGGYSRGSVSLTARHLLEPGRLTQEPQGGGWSLLDLGTGQVLRTPSEDPGTATGSTRDRRLAALAGDQLLAAERAGYSGSGGCWQVTVAAYQDPLDQQPRWTTRIVAQDSQNLAATLQHGLIWLTSAADTSSGYGPGPMIQPFDVALDPSTGRPPAWYREPTECDDQSVGYLPVDGQHVLRVSQPDGGSGKERWEKRKYELLDATGRRLWKTDDPLMVHDGRLYQLTAPDSYTDYVATDARLLDVNTGKPVWEEAVPGYPVATVGDHVLLRGYPGITVAAGGTGAVRSTQAVGRDGSVAVLGDTYYLASPRGSSTAVSAYAVADGQPLWTQVYEVTDGQLVASGDQLALGARESGTLFPLKPPG